jgi:hypothetical protein
MPKFILYGTVGCHLCELAEAQLAELLAALQNSEPATKGREGAGQAKRHSGSVADVEIENADIESVEIECIDISGDDELLVRYGESIPVLRRLVDHAEINWPFEDSALRAFLQY